MKSKLRVLATIVFAVIIAFTLAACGGGGGGGGGRFVVGSFFRGTLGYSNIIE